MIRVIFYLILLIGGQLSANEFCRGFYSHLAKASINQTSPSVQVFRHRGLHYKIIKLKELNPTSKEYSQAFYYLNKQYPMALNKAEDFLDKINSSNSKLWEQMHLVLAFEADRPETIISGAAFISVTSPQQKLGFEWELNLNFLPRESNNFFTATEVGRLSVDLEHKNKRKILDSLLVVLHQSYLSSSDYKNLYIFSSRYLQKYYKHKGLNFKEIEEITQSGLLSEGDIVSQFIKD